MFIYTFKFDRKKAAFCVVVAALVLIGIILLVGAHNKAEAIEQRGTAASSAPAAAEGGNPRKKTVTTVKNEKNRVAYLAQYGWEVESPPENECEVMIPRSFSAVFEDYNALQKQQGFDLSRYCGEEVTMYTYRVRNAPAEFGDEVLAVLYVKNNAVIGGDIHSTAIDGKMTGIIGN